MNGLDAMPYKKAVFALSIASAMIIRTSASFAVTLCALMYQYNQHQA